LKHGLCDIKEINRLKAFENRVLRRIFRPKRVEIMRLEKITL
jgi:hypothetical protein